MTWKRIAAALVLTGAVVAGVVHWRRSRPPSWQEAARIERSVMVVDYTVPFDNYREHIGLMWLLNHFKVTPPKGAASWQISRHYVGYAPSDRANPRRVSEADLTGIETIFVVDTYGVYLEDLEDIPNRRAHMDFAKLKFGGLSLRDAETLSRFADGGGTLVSEFNTFATPTGGDARAVMERAHGVRWTGWVGRVFADPADENDVPGWVPREFPRQFPGQSYPTEPFLLLVDDGGKMHLFPAPTLAEVAPRMRLTDAGQRAVGSPREAGYYAWFDVVEVTATEASVLVELQLPELDGVAELLESIGVSSGLPAVVERRTDRGLRVYLSTDLADVEFKLGRYDQRDAIETGRARSRTVAGPSSMPGFFSVYAPLVERWLRRGR